MSAERVAGLIPCYEVVPPRATLAAVLGHVDRLLIVDDGSSATVAARLQATANREGIDYVRLTPNAGKGSAIRVGLRFLRRQQDAPEAVLMLDGDGQHPPAAIPALLTAPAELVIGDRLGDRANMPSARRAANMLSRTLLGLTTGRTVGDSQSGMRLLRGRALDLGMPDGRYEAETVHLKRCLQAGVSVMWVPIPAIYAGERSGFRAVRDGLLVLRALAGPAPKPERHRRCARPGSEASS